MSAADICELLSSVSIAIADAVAVVVFLMQLKSGALL